MNFAARLPSISFFSASNIARVESDFMRKNLSVGIPGKLTAIILSEIIHLPVSENETFLSR